MNKVNVNYFHLADAASVDSGGKVNILGIFDTINLNQIPSKYPKFTIIANLSINELEQIANTVQIKIFDPEGKEMEIKPPIEFKFNANVNKKNEGGMNLILDLNGIEFKTYGKYRINLLFNNKIMYKKILKITERKR